MFVSPQFSLHACGLAMQSLSHDSSKPRPSVKLGGDYLELTAEEERRLISKQGHRVAPQLNGVHYHFQLLDLFAISSVGTFLLERLRL